MSIPLRIAGGSPVYPQYHPAVPQAANSSPPGTVWNPEISKVRLSRRCEPFMLQLSSVPEASERDHTYFSLIRHSANANCQINPRAMRCARKSRQMLLIILTLACMRSNSAAIPFRTNPHPVESNFPHIACRSRLLMRVFDLAPQPSSGRLETPDRQKSIDY
jgi:hypothetical protein